MKRIFPLVAILAILLSLFVVPAAADSYPYDEVLGTWLYFDPIVVDVQYIAIGKMSMYLSESFSITQFEDDQEIVFYDALFGEDFKPPVSVLFNGVLYEDVPYSSLGIGNPVLGNALYWSDPDSFTDENNGLPFYLRKTGTQWALATDAITGDCSVALYIGYPPMVESLDYEDFAQSSVVSGDFHKVSVSFPSDYAASYFLNYDVPYDNEFGAPRYKGGSFTHDFAGSTGVDHYIRAYPFGFGFALNSQYVYCGKALSLHNIPDDAHFKVTYLLEMNSTINWLYEPEDQTFHFRVAQISSPGVVISVESGYYDVVDIVTRGGKSYMKVVFEYEFSNLHDDADYIAFCAGFGVGVQTEGSGEVTFIIDDLQLEMTISALAGQAAQANKTNKLLTQVSKQLEEQGKTLNEVLNGSSDMQDKADQITGAVSDKVQQGNQMMDALDSVARPGVSDALVLPDYVSGEMPLYLSSLVREFGETDLVFNMFTMAGLVMLASYILFGKKV